MKRSAALAGLVFCALAGQARAGDDLPTIDLNAEKQKAAAGPNQAANKDSIFKVDFTPAPPPPTPSFAPLGDRKAGYTRASIGKGMDRDKPIIWVEGEDYLNPPPEVAARCRVGLPFYALQVPIHYALKLSMAINEVFKDTESCTYRATFDHENVHVQDFTQIYSDPNNPPIVVGWLEEDQRSFLKIPTKNNPVCLAVAPTPDRERWKGGAEAARAAYINKEEEWMVVRVGALLDHYKNFAQAFEDKRFERDRKKEYYTVFCKCKGQWGALEPPDLKCDSDSAPNGPPAPPAQP